MTDLNIDSTIRDVIVANRILAREEVLDGFGHVSLRHPHDPGRYFLSRSRSPELVTRDDIIEFTLDGDPVTPTERSPYIERVIHGAIYKMRPDVQAVVHHHARAVLPFTITEAELKPVFHMASVIGPRVPLWDSQAEFGDTDLLVDDFPKGNALASALGDNTCALLRGHGAVCVGRDVREMVMTAVYMKENAELILRTLPLGAPTYLTPGEVEMTRKTLFGPNPLKRSWDYWVARAGYEGM